MGSTAFCSEPGAPPLPLPPLRLVSFLHTSTPPHMPAHQQPTHLLATYESSLLKIPSPAILSLAGGMRLALAMPMPPHFSQPLSPEGLPRHPSQPSPGLTNPCKTHPPPPEWLPPHPQEASRSNPSSSHCTPPQASPYCNGDIVHSRAPAERPNEQSSLMGEFHRLQSLPGVGPKLAVNSYPIVCSEGMG